MPSPNPISNPVQLWDVALGLHDWRATGTVTSLDELAHAVAGTASALIELGGDAPEKVFRAAGDILAAVPSWAVQLSLVGLSPRRVARLARETTMFLLDRRLGHLVPVHTYNPAVIDRLLRSGWVDPSRALLLSSPGLVASW